MNRLSGAFPKGSYRPDIDGLRALAVLLVVIFHAAPHRLPGGFIGVDVFFVISGFLITSLLLEDFEARRFNFFDFYARRIRRLFPALGLVLGFSYAAGWWLLIPSEFALLGKHVMAGATFVSNFVLWSESGYFDEAAATKPLLHLWSLGIEEQFYLIWPLLLWATRKRPTNILVAMVVLSSLSFAFSVVFVKQNASTAFFLPHTRLWELGCGGLLSWGTRRGWLAAPRNSRWASKWSAGGLASIGLVIVCLGAFALREENFPGLWALVPVSGAMLVIAAGSQAGPNRWLLSNRVASGIGLISYPLYLWHWPILTYARIHWGENPPLGIRAIGIVIAFVLAWATYRFIEKPIRFHVGRKRILTGLTGAMVTLLFVGTTTYVSRGIRSRFPPETRDLAAFEYDYQPAFRGGLCFLAPHQDYADFSRCPDDTKNKKFIVLWGDSHAASLYAGYEAAYGKEFSIVQRTASDCPPILGFQEDRRPNCHNINRNVFDWLRTHPPDRLVLSGSWVLRGLDGLDDTVKALRSVGLSRIEIVGPLPIWKHSLPKLLFWQFAKRPRENLPKRLRDELDPYFLTSDDALRTKAAALSVDYRSPRDVLCDEQGCLTLIGDSPPVPTAFDYGHLTAAAAIYLVNRFREQELRNRPK